MASTPSKIVSLLAGNYQNEFTKQQFRKYFFRAGYGWEKIDKQWSKMIQNDVIRKVMTDAGYQKTNDQSEPLWKLDL